MFTFSICLLPLVLGFYFLQSDKKVNIIMIITGSLTAFLIFALKEFFTLSHRVIPLSFQENFLFLFFREAFIPVVLLYGIFFLISKDTTDFKFEAFFPLTASFYCVYLPYIVITSPESTTVFEILAKPVFFTSMLISLSQGLSLVQAGLKEKKGLIPAGIIMCIAAFLIPASAEALFLIDSPVIYVILLLILTIIISATKPLVEFFTKK